MRWGHRGHDEHRVAQLRPDCQFQVPARLRPRHCGELYQTQARVDAIDPDPSHRRHIYGVRDGRPLARVKDSTGPATPVHPDSSEHRVYASDGEAAGGREHLPRCSRHPEDKRLHVLPGGDSPRDAVFNAGKHLWDPKRSDLPNRIEVVEDRCARCAHPIGDNDEVT